MSNLLPTEDLNLSYAEEAAQSSAREVERNLIEIRNKIIHFKNRVSSATNRVKENAIPIGITAGSILAVFAAIKHTART